ncbi:MAG TPA: hypothetical protein PKE12_04800 [Kiritimatiellia bacterium]|nr:hypothetical protein [Kiritimatiellia bacterium]
MITLASVSASWLTVNARPSGGRISGACEKVRIPDHPRLPIRPASGITRLSSRDFLGWDSEVAKRIRL